MSTEKKAKITATDVLEWLDNQPLMYASWPVDDLRLRLLYLPRRGRWEVWLGPISQLYGGHDLVEACAVFNKRAGL